MIYQVKGISGYVWVGAVWAGVCAGVPGCAQVSTDVRKCTYMYLGVYGCEWVCAGVCGMRGCVWKCAVVCKCVCWMNFQNIFWRLESIHQRTLIRILDEFFQMSLTT